MKDEKALKKRKTAIVILAVVALLALFVLYKFVAITHEYGPYYGKVVDKETGEPIEGAVVLAVYYTETWWLTTEKSFYIDADEVLTDESGEYHIPANRLLTFRPLHWWNPYPQFTIFKPGYGAYPDHKDVSPMYVPAGTLPANEDITVNLPSLIQLEERIKALPTLNYDVSYHEQAKLINLLNQENEYLGIKGKYTEESFKRRH
jgi:hypothetical protein